MERLRADAVPPSRLGDGTTPPGIALGWERLEAALAVSDPPDGADTLAATPVAALLDAVFAHSPYLTRLAAREAAFLVGSLNVAPEHSLNALLSEAESAGALTDVKAAEKALRVAKRRLALLTAMADLAGVWPLETVTDALSRFAEAALDAATAFALGELIAAGKIAPQDGPDGRPAGFFLLGMGKLGAGELNYSSDVDVIALYDPERLRPADPDRMRQDMVRATQRIVHLMEARTGDGYVFRTDLRLRPDPGMTPLAMTVEAAESYYESVGQNWERAAMIKARPVAGDRALGAAFLRAISPFVWRRHLDFAAVADVHSIKRQINSFRGGQEISIEGHNIKLGRGGIREIEFFAQTQQLIWGGRTPQLRGRGTVGALRDLAEYGHISNETAETLAEDYRFLRTLEHRLQMQNDEQTQKLPDDPQALSGLGCFFGYAKPDGFRRALAQRLNSVSTHYAGLFEDAPNLGGSGALVFTGSEDHPDTLDTLKRMGFDSPSHIADRVRAWHYGRYRATRSERARQILTELTPHILERLSDAHNPGQAFAKFDGFLEALPSGVQIFSLFQSNPEIADLVCEIMSKAPRLADWLSRKPSLLDGVLGAAHIAPDDRGQSLRAALADALDHARDFQDALDTVRRWANDRRFLTGVALLQGRTNGEEAGPVLSAVAEAAIGGLTPWVEGEFRRAHGLYCGADDEERGYGFAVLAFGKLGGAELAPMSDLDLVFVYRTPEGVEASQGEKPLAPMVYYTRLCQRLSTAITAQTPEGELYELDTRLRPNGRAGPLATNFETLAPYYETEAWTWELMALTRARVIQAPAALSEALTDLIERTLRRPRDPDTLLVDVAAMRMRIATQHRSDRPWKVKHRRGGLLDIEFIAQYLQLRHAPSGADILSQNSAAALGKLAAAGLLDDSDADALIAALSEWRRIQALLRLTALDAFDPDTAPDGQKALLANAFGADSFQALSDHLDRTAATAAALYDRIIAEPAAAASAEPAAT